MNMNVPASMLFLSALAVFPLVAAETNEHAACHHSDCCDHSSGGFVWSQGEMETNKIDLLFVFDRSSCKWLSDSPYATSSNFSQVVIADMNAALSRTDLDRHFTFRLAGLTEIQYSFAGENPHRLASIAAGMQKAEGMEKEVFKRIRAARNRHKADIVAVFVGDCVAKVHGGSVSLNHADFRPPMLEKFKERAYCFCSIGHVMTRYTLLHEVGHIMGAGHFADDALGLKAGPQLFHYSSSHYFQVGDDRYTTIMGGDYNGHDQHPWKRIPMFSSPAHTFVDSRSGKPVDTGVKVGTADHDNSRTLRESYPYVANFRVAQKMDVIPVDPNAIRLSVVTGGVVMANKKVVHARCLIAPDIVIRAESAVKPRVNVIGLPMGMRYSDATGRIVGWPVKPGKYTVKVSASNKSAYTATLKFAINVRSFAGEKKKAGPPPAFIDRIRWQHQWKRPEGTLYSLPQPLTVRLTSETPGDVGLAAGDWIDISLTGPDGSGRASGEIAGVKVSSFLTLLRFAPGGGAKKSQERVECLVSFPPQEGTPFVGYLRWVKFLVTVDSEWHIIKLDVVSAKKV